MGRLEPDAQAVAPVQGEPRPTRRRASGSSVCPMRFQILASGSQNRAKAQGPSTSVMSIVGPSKRLRAIEGGLLAGCVWYPLLPLRDERWAAVRRQLRLHCARIRAASPR